LRMWGVGVFAIGSFGFSMISNRFVHLLRLRFTAGMATCPLPKYS